MLILRSPTDPAESSPFEFQSCSQDFMCDQMPGNESRNRCPHSDKYNQDVCGKSVSAVEKTNYDSDSFVFPSYSQRSTSTTMSGSQTPLHVYHRRRFILDPAQTSVENENGDGSPSAISSDAHSPATRDQLVSVETETEGVRSPCVPPAKCSTEGIVSKCGSYNGCPDGEEPDEGLRSDSGRILDICCIDDSCSSSKLNLDLISVSVRTDGDDTGESSSSGGLVSESLRENMSERDICISIIRSHGLVEIASPRQDSISADDGAMASDQDCLRTCKVCGCSETSCKMLICDQCDDAFHTSCCIPRIKRLPTDEWFCYSCLKKKRKLLKENSSNAAANVSNEDKFGPIANMLKDNKPLKSSVRVGPDYQAEVPDWAGPVIEYVFPIIFTNIIACFFS